MSHLFAVNLPVWEIVVRGTLIYWLLFLLFRFVLRRTLGAVGVGDILLLVLIADAAQNGMAGEYTTISEGAILIATLGAWDWACDWIAFHSPAVARILEPAPVPLMRRGRILRRNLRRELISEEDLLAKLRHLGVEDPSDVRLATMESDGEISVLRAHKPEAPQTARSAKKSANVK